MSHAQRRPLAVLTRGRHRDLVLLFDSTALNLVEENSREMFSGAALEVIPSSILSFHHPHHFRTHPDLDESGGEDTTVVHWPRGSGTESYAEHDVLLNRVASNALEQLHETRSGFKFFTADEIENAPGGSTLEDPDQYVDYDTHWDYDTDRRRGLVADLENHDLALVALSLLQYGRLLRRRYRLMSRALRLRLVGYGSTNNLPQYGDSVALIDRHRRSHRDHSGDDDDARLSHFSNFSDRLRSSSRGSSREERDSVDGLVTDGRQRRWLRKRARDSTREKHAFEYPSKLHHQRFYIAEEDLVVGIAGYRLSWVKSVVYYAACWCTLGLAYLVFRWWPRYRIGLRGVPTALGNAEWLVIENEYGELDIIDVERRYYDRRLSTYLSPEVASDETRAREDPVNGAAANGTATNGAAVGGEAADEMATDSTPVSDSAIFATENPVVPYLVLFHYRYLRFFYTPVEDMFRTNSTWYDPAWMRTDLVRQGLSKETVRERVAIFGHNVIDIKAKTVGQLLVDEVLHPFYMFQVFLIGLWLMDDYYYYAFCIFVISLVSIVQTLVETKLLMRRLEEMLKQLYEIRALRNDFWTTIDLTELVVGDLYEVDPLLNTVPSDSVLISGDCIVNELMLTGELVPVLKILAGHDALAQLASDFKSATLAKLLLFNGTKILKSKREHDEPVMALVVATGFSTTKGLLIRLMLFPKPMGFKFYRDLFRYIGFMLAVAMVGFVVLAVNFVRLGVLYRTMILRALDIVTIVVPPALPATLTIGTLFALARLKQREIFCISPTRVNVGGKVDVFAFDKTGTLTEDGLNVLGVHVLEPAPDRKRAMFGDLVRGCEGLAQPALGSGGMVGGDAAYRKKREGCSRNLLLCMATCHTVRDVDGVLVGDPLDLEMFAFTRWEFAEDHLADDGNHKCVAYPEGRRSSGMVVVRSFEFVSQLRRMLVVVEPAAGPSPGSTGLVFAKGAPEVMVDVCDRSTLPENYDELLQHYTHSGFRVIACAYKRVDQAGLPVDRWEREDAELRMRFLGFIVFENKLKAGTKPTLAVLREAQLRTLMCTGDNILTAISVARECGLVNPAGRVFVPTWDENSNHTNILWEDVNDLGLRLDPVTLEPVRAVQSGLSLSILPSPVDGHAIHDSLALHDAHAIHGVHAMQQMEAVGHRELAMPSLTDYTLAITGDVFRYLLTTLQDKRLIAKVLMKTDVYARMLPDEKHELVEQLQKLDYTVGFCGDGANDCGALKAADVGISLSEAEALVAAPFTSRVFEILCVLDVIREGRAALVTLFLCFQYMLLYSAIQFVTITVLYLRGSNLGDFQFLYIDLFLILPIAVFMLWLKAADGLCVKRPTANLVLPKILIPLVCNIAVLLLFQVVVWQHVQRMGWYIHPVPGDDDAVQLLDNTVLFELSNFQYVLVAAVLTKGRPYREPVLQNTPFVVNVAVAIGISMGIMWLSPSGWWGRLMDLTPVLEGFKWEIMCAWVANLGVMMWLDLVVYLPLARCFKRWFGLGESKKLFKRLRQQHAKDVV